MKNISLKNTGLAALLLAAALTVRSQIVVQPVTAPATPPPTIYRVSLNNTQSVAMINAVSAQVKLANLSLTNLARLDFSGSFTATTNGLQGYMQFRQVNTQ